MSDTLERRVRETLQRKADGGSILPATPPQVLKRVRRRQVGNVLMAGLTLAALAVGSVIGIRSVIGGRGGTLPANGDLKTTTIRGVTITYPATWYLEPFDRGYLPLTHYSVPIFALANYRPPAPFAALPDSAVCRPRAIVLAVEEDFGVPPGPASAPPSWPVQLQPAAVGLKPAHCVTAYAATWTARGRRFYANAYAGPHASEKDLQAIFAAFRSMSFSRVPAPAGDVIATGTNEGIPWVLTARRSGNGMSLAFQAGGIGSGSGAAFPGPAPFVPTFVATQVAGNTVFVYGVVPERVTYVETSLVCCPPPVRTALYPLPAHFGLKGKVVLAQLPRTAAGYTSNAGKGVLVAYAKAVVVRQRFTYSTSTGGPSPAPTPIATLTVRASPSP